jgi:hypothetical protein
MTEQVKVGKAKSVVGGEVGTAGKSSIHYDRPLSDFAVKVIQDDSEFKASGMLSNFNSKHRQDMYYFYEPAYFMVNQVAERAEGTEAARARYGVSRKSYATKVYALKQPVTDEQVANGDQLVDRAYEDATSFISRQFLLNKEKKLAGAIMKDGVWSTDWEGQDAALTGSAVVTAGKFQKFTEAASKPLDVLDSLMETIQLRSGMRPNTVTFTRAVFTVLKRNAQIKTLKLYTNANSTSDDATLDTIAGHIGIPASNIFILDVVEPASAATVDGTTYKITTDTEGYVAGTEDDDTTSVANQFVGGNGILMMHINASSNGAYEATAAVCAQWTGLYPEGGALGNTVIKRYREERLSSEMIEGRCAFSYHIVAPALGGYLKDVL